MEYRLQKHRGMNVFDMFGELQGRGVEGQRAYVGLVCLGQQKPGPNLYSSKVDFFF